MGMEAQPFTLPMQFDIFAYLLKAAVHNKKAEDLVISQGPKKGASLVVNAITAKQYSTTFDLIKTFPKFSVENDELLLAIARTFPSDLNYWEELIYPPTFVDRLKEGFDLLESSVVVRWPWHKSVLVLGAYRCYLVLRVSLVQQVVKADDCVGPEVEKLVASLPEGGVLLLENVRFYKKEEKNDPAFAEKLASIADLYVNDAFGTAHRAHASTEGVTKFLSHLLLELDCLDGAVSNPKRPFAAIVGGSKAQGLLVGSSLVEEDMLDLATTLLAKGKEKGVSLLLPTDVVVADKFAPDANSKIVPASGIPRWLDGIGYWTTVKTFSDALETTKTVIWNGPMGVFEFDKFAIGTEAVAKKLAELSGKGVTTIIGGGDSVSLPPIC
ncbi:hypothetical protein L6452_26768 [Arctium lappa]|uniref:Uncharacterized protein n=1 Tax=Arctium lappa TaxID=4217 RepID=A0ACB8ZWM2_ARCLA|nr:hypothetical protein L6452_26768 [Arctium lappa]